MLKRFFKWINRRSYTHSRKLSDYRATSMAVKLALGGSLQRDNLTGSPLVRGR